MDLYKNWLVKIMRNNAGKSYKRKKYDMMKKLAGKYSKSERPVKDKRTDGGKTLRNC